MLPLKIRHFNFLSKSIIGVADCLLSVFSTFFCFLFFHYLLNVETPPKVPLQVLGIAVACSALCIRICQTYKGIIRHTSLGELMRIAYAMGMKAILYTGICCLTLDYVGLFIYSQIVADFICSVFLLTITRAFIVNFYYNLLANAGKDNPNTLIYGTSEAAISLANYLKNSKKSEYRLKGFVTRDPQLKNYRILGYPVYYVNDVQDIDTLFKNVQVNNILFINNRDLHSDEQLLNYGLNKHITLRIAPLMEDIQDAQHIQLRNVQIEDLLGRDEIKINMANIQKELSGRVIMVTGAAGSIGSELCRQLCKFHLKKLILFDFSETATYQINMELTKRYPGHDILSVIGDVRNLKRVESQIERYRPNIIFHAAAYKHVPLMEEYPCEAVRANVMGTRIVADTAIKYGVEKFIMISTDKAVRPSNVMGATKRIAEMYVQSLGEAVRQGKVKGQTEFITTRFGNVLGSNGSVIPLFRQQILEGGPVTVTHKDITRFFMTIPEASRLVLEAAFLGRGNDIFIFDMGKPVKIADLATRMIKLAGFIPGKDIEIKYTGLRPGEKLYEELLYNKENTLPTGNQKIFRAKTIDIDYAQLDKSISKLIDIAHTDDKTATVKQMKSIAPDFISQHSIYEKLDQ